jgi:NADPH-dependent curcumin reductase CurA
MSQMNRQVTLASRPEGLPKDSDFALVETPVPEPEEGYFVVKALTLSVDPYMRGRLRDRKSYAEPVAVGDVMVGESVARVVSSRHPGFREGIYVRGMFGWQEYAVTSGRGVRIINEERAPHSTALHVLGMPGLTAYFGLLDVCEPKAGEIVVVSGGAGAVGSAVGQLAKIHGCKVVGIAGSDEKVAFMKELGFDAGFNYKTTDNYYAKLKELCPDGIDVYYDNVGGPITDAVFPLLNLHARVGICGQISQYNLEKPDLGPRILWHLIPQRAKVQGFLVFDFVKRHDEALQKLGDWVAEGKLKYRESYTDGLENALSAFRGLFDGANIGKQLVRVAADE